MRHGLTERNSFKDRAVEVARVLEAAAALVLATLATRLLPFRIVVRLTGVAGSDSPLAGDDRNAEEISKAVRRAARRLPWRIVCLQEGLAAHWMLRGRGRPSRLHYGLKQSGAELSAHVWVTLGENVVIGGETIDPHICVAVFPRASN